jgi:hypothetical protein
VSVRAGKLEMIGLAWKSKHDTIESIMVLEAIQFLQTKAVFVKVDHGVDVIRRPRYAKCGRRLSHCLLVHFFQRAAENAARVSP